MLGGDELTETWNDFSYFEDDADDDEVYDGPTVILLAIGSEPVHSNARTCQPGPVGLAGAFLGLHASA